MLLEGLARYLDDQGLVTFDPSGAGGNCFIGVLPAQPDVAVALYPLGGPQPDPKHGYDTPAVQFLVRSTQDPRPGLQRAEAIYQALHGIRYMQLPDGTLLLWGYCTQSGPVDAGRDETGRHVYSMTFHFEIKAPDGGYRE